MVKFEAPGIKSKFIRQFEFSEDVEGLYGKRCWRARPCSPSTFPIQIFQFFSKNSDRQKISFFNDGGLKLVQHSPEYIENTKMVKFEAPGIKSKFIRQFEFSENVEDLYGNVAGEQGRALHQLSPYKSSCFFKKIQTVKKSHSLTTGA